MDELVQIFRMEDVSKSPAKFDYTKLKDINKAWMLKMDADKYNEKVLDFLSSDMADAFRENSGIAENITSKIIKEKISCFGDLKEMEESGDFEYFFSSPVVADEKLIFKDGTLDDSKKYLAEVVEKISLISELD